MANSHSRVYPTVYIRQSVLNSLQPSLRQLEHRTDTSIFYNETGGYFDITARDQKACDQARDKISNALLPRLNQSIDDRNLKGTYKTLAIIRDENLIGVPVIGEPEVKVVKINGQPLKLEDEEEEEEEEEDNVHDDDDEEEDKLIIETFNISAKVRSIKAFLTSPIQQNMQNGDYLKLVGKATGTDCALINRSIQISGFDVESVNDALARFTVIQTTYLGLSKRMLVPCIDYPKTYYESGLYYCSMNHYKKRAFIQNQFFPEADISDLYIILPVFMDDKKGQYGPPKDLILRQDRQQHRQVQQHQAEQQRANEAMLNRMMQSTTLNHHFKQVRPEMMRPPMPRQASPPFNPTVYTTLQPHTPPPSSSTKSVHTRQQHVSPPSPSVPRRQQQHDLYQHQRKHNHTQASNYASSQRTPIPSSPPRKYTASPTNYDHSRASSVTSGARQYPSSSDSESVSTLDEFQSPLWGVVNAYNMGASLYLSAIHDDGKALIPDMDHFFPVLPNLEEIPKRRAHSRASSVKSIESSSGRRVMRIVNLKSAHVVAAASTMPRNPWEVKEEYNFDHIKMALEEGLGAVRGFKGEVKLCAKLGKILWGRVDATVHKRIWDYTEIKDIVVRELGAVPHFSESTTVDNDMVDAITDKLPKRYSGTSTYEFHCLARNMPQVDYKETVLYMNEGAMELFKVTISERRLTEVDWVSLDRNMDFQMTLTTKELVRPDAKPYTTFIKWVSVCPITRLMTFEEVNDFLYVDYVLHKETSRYKAIFPFTLEITRVEKVPLREVKTTQFTKAKKLQCQINTGSGEVWYDIELVHSAHTLRFKSNIDLETGKTASWDVQDILGETDSSELRNYLNAIKSLINLTEEALSSSININ
ncbi:hypothetical protein K501DRAFT_52311 [Backusella circina FSU 941]|nr:hypothetical protein K501DRAFT_52311 [Backusella circina FSU 941]